MASPRNRTLTLSPEEIDRLAASCLGEGDDLARARDAVLLGDTFALLPRLAPASVDLAIVDPPYNLTKTYGETRFSATDADRYRDFTDRWLDALLPLLKPTASIYVCCDWRSSLIVGERLERRLILRNRITWQREKGRGAEKNWKNGMEDIWFATVSGDYTFHLDAVRQRRRVIAPYHKDGQPKDWQDTPDGKFRDTCPSNFWDDCSVPYWSMPENTPHPTQKPEKLMAKLILASSSKGDLVLDPFLGSGTTAVTAKKLGRHYLGIEREREYAAYAVKRLALADTDPAIQGYTDGVFWERNTAAEQKKYLK